MNAVLGSEQTNTKQRRWFVPTLVAIFFGIIGGAGIFVSAATSTQSLWPKSTVPSVISANDSKGVELGVKFQAKVAGAITGIRFYKGAQNTGTHTGSLWDSHGNLLASATFKNETSSGWQTVKFAQAVNIAANVTYVAAYYAPHGHYSYNYNYFTTAHTKNNLTALQSTSGNVNGLYSYSASQAYPSQGYKDSNYWVDVLFKTDLVGNSPAPAPPVSIQATQQSNTIVVTWAASLSANPINHYIVLRNGNQVTTVSGTTLSYTDSQITAGDTYAYQIEAVDSTGKTSTVSPTATITYNVTPTPPTGGGGGTPTPTPTPTGSFVKPHSVGYLGSAAALTVYTYGGNAPSGCSWQSYGLRCDQDNLTLDHVKIVGGLYWTGTGNANITNSVIEGSSAGGDQAWYAFYAAAVSSSAGAKITVTDSTLGWDGSTEPAGQDVGPIWSRADQVFDVERCDLSGMPQGIDPSTTGSIVKNNWIHDLNQNGTASTPSHIDGIYSQGGSNITIVGNYVDVPVRSDVTAAVFIQDREGTDGGIVIDNNYLNGGAYVLRDQTGVGVVVDGDTFGNSLYGYVGDLTGYQGSYSEWLNDTTVTGVTVPKP